MKTLPCFVLAIVFALALPVQAQTLQSGRNGTRSAASSGTVDAIMNSVISQGKHVPSSKSVLSNGWVRDWYLTKDWNNGAWENLVQATFTYDLFGDQLSQLGQSWENSAWKNDLLQTWTYDDQGNEITHSSQGWNGSEWSKSAIDTEMYNADGQRTSLLSRYLSGSAWVNQYLYSYAYDANGNETIDLCQNWSGGAWVNSRRWTFTYDANGYYVKFLWEVWSNGAWVNYGQSIITNDPNGRETYSLQQAWYGGAWVNYGQDTFTYDGNGRKDTDLYDTWTNNAWVHSTLNSFTYDLNGNRTDELEKAWKLNSWVNSRWYIDSWVKISAIQIQVTKPATSEVVLAGEPYNIRWKSAGIDSVTLELSLDGGTTFTRFVRSAPASSGKYHWAVPDTLSAKCKIRISDLADNTVNSLSNQFRIKGYILTRFKANGDYEPFDPAIHGWQFANSDTNMWPYSWWDQFNYRSGIDPYTAQRYDSMFVGVYRLAFPDWPLFVRAFGIGNCYENTSPVVYSERAYWYWRSILAVWRGSCFGFSVSSLINFDYETFFKASYPQLGDFSRLNDLPINDSTRLIVNLYYLYWFGSANRQSFDMQGDKTPLETLQDLKTMFLSEIRNDQSLYLRDVATPNAHSVVPYALQTDPGTGEVKVFVYDNNCPGGDCGNGTTNPFILIDSVRNFWSYPLKHWPSSTVFLPNHGLFLESPVNTFLNRAILPLSNFPVQYPPVRSPFGVGPATVMIFSTPGAAISITDAASGSIGFHDSVVVNTFSNGTPIIPPTSQFAPPLGYLIPNGPYTIQLNSFQDTLSRISVFDTLRVYSYWRTDAQKGQSDNLSYSNGIAVGNPDPQAKKINLETVLTLPASERTAGISNCSLMQSDSLRMSTPDSGQVKLVNLGSQKTYDLNIKVGGPGIAGKYRHTGITVPAHSTHYILPYWLDLHQPLRIMEDVGNKGAISDTLTLADQTTGVNGPARTGIPEVFALEQNYPNPFNPATTIRYQLPVATMVKIVVYDILGREVSLLVNEWKNAGVYTVQFEAGSLASGVYFYRIQAGSFVETKKFLLLK